MSTGEFIEHLSILHDKKCTHASRFAPLVQPPGCLELEWKMVREKRCKGGLSGVGDCSGGTRYEKESFQSSSSLLRVSCFSRRRPGTFNSGTLRSSCFVALRDSIQCDLVIRDGNSELVGLQLVQCMHLLMTLGKPTALV